MPKRPEMSDKNANISNYDTILVGFPVWWYLAPNIILTFLESYDFTGKKVVVWGMSVVIFFDTLFVALFIGKLFVLHLYLIFENLTFYEYIKKKWKKPPGVNPYYKTCCYSFYRIIMKFSPKSWFFMFYNNENENENNKKNNDKNLEKNKNEINKNANDPVTERINISRSSSIRHFSIRNHNESNYESDINSNLPEIVKYKNNNIINNNKLSIIDGN